MRNYQPPAGTPAAGLVLSGNCLLVSQIDLRIRLCCHTAVLTLQKGHHATRKARRNSEPSRPGVLEHPENAPESIGTKP